MTLPLDISHMALPARTMITDHASVRILEALGGDDFIEKYNADDFFSSDNPQPRMQFAMPHNNRMVHFEISEKEDLTLIVVMFTDKGDGKRNFLHCEYDSSYDELKATFEDMLAR